MADQEGEKTAEETFKVPAPVSTAVSDVQGTYEAPEWGAIPEHIDYTLEIIRSGTVLKKLPLSTYCRRSNKGWVSFGRVPDNDWPVEHPSTSRYHCVIQFDTHGKLFVYDLGSTHGTYINKSRIKPHEYVEFRVGDQMRIADSERMYILSGPQDLMPSQGLSREEKRQALALEAYQNRKKEEEQKAVEQMQSALQAGGQSVASTVQLAILSGVLDWRAYAKDTGLTDKQQKMVNTLEKKERQMEALRKENERIHSKQSSSYEEGLTPGQMETVDKNETKLEILSEQYESVEEDLIESIRHSIEGKHGPKPTKRPVSDKDVGSDDDTFYDRTGTNMKKKCRQTKAGESVDAKELVTQVDLLDQEIQSLEKQVSQMNSALSKDQNRSHPATDDDLDTYLESLDSIDTVSKIKNLQKKVQNLKQEREKTVKMLKIADPQGYYSRTR